MSELGFLMTWPSKKQQYMYIFTYINIYICLAVQGGQSDDVGSELAFKLAGTLKAEIKQEEQPPKG